MKNLFIPLLLPLVLWIVHSISWVFDLPLYKMGIKPRAVSGIIGIFTAPLIHGDFGHLISNTAPLVILGLSIFYFYKKVAYKSFIVIYLTTGLLVWLLGRDVYHIGASGIIYGFVAFLFFNGLFRRDNKSIALSLLVIFLYGSLIWGVLPGVKGISWESHLFGAISGLIASFLFRKIDPPRKYDWENDPNYVKSENLEVSYDADKNKFLEE